MWGGGGGAEINSKCAYRGGVKIIQNALIGSQGVTEWGGGGELGGETGVP